MPRPCKQVLVFAALCALPLGAIVLCMAPSGSIVSGTSHPGLSPRGATYHTHVMVARAIGTWVLAHHEYPAAADMDELEARIMPLLKQLNERERYKVRFDAEGHVVDGWGRRLRLRMVRADGERAPYFFYSVGANGVDEGGKGDDVMWWEPDDWQRDTKAREQGACHIGKP